MNHEYSVGVDVWSAGCILAECCLREVLFRGRDYLEQTRLICEGLGAPSAATLARTVESRAAAEYISRFPPTPSKPVSARLPAGTEPSASALLMRLLAFDAAARPSAAEALSAPYFESLRGLNEEPDAPPLDFAFEEEGVGEKELVDLVHSEMECFHPELVRGGGLGGGALPQAPSSCEL